MRITAWVRISLLALTLCRLSAMTTSELDQAWIGIATPASTLDTRFTFSIVLEAAAAQWHPERMQQLLQTAGHSMNRSPSSNSYGNLGSTYGSTPIDDNVGLFCMQNAVATWDLYRANLPQDAQATLHDLLAVGLQHVLAYRVNPDYTNIFLLKAFDCIALGEALGDAATSGLGYGMLDSFLAYTQANGIHEYLSPTYYGVDLEAMAMTQRLAQDPTGSAKAVLIQNLFWTDMAANWFQPAERFAGAHSRDHDYLHGHGKCDMQLEKSGWLQHRTADFENFPNATSTYASLATSTPPASVTGITQVIPRTVQAQWGTQPWQLRTSYLSNHVALGTSGGSYCLEDKLFKIDIAGADDSIANVCYDMDYLGDPYGQSGSINYLSGHSLQHLTPVVLAHQIGADALVLVSEELATSDPLFPTATGIHSNILIPMGAQIWSGTTAIAMPTIAAAITLPLNQPVFIKSGDAAVGIRFVYASAAQGQPATLSLVNDGSAYGACRLRCEHIPAAPTAAVSVQLAMHVRVADGLDQNSFNAFQATFSGVTYTQGTLNSVLDVSASIPQGPLHVALNTTTNTPLQVGNGASAKSVLTINGVDVGSQVLSSSSQTQTQPQSQSSPSKPAAGLTGDVPSSSSHGCGLGSGVGLLMLLVGKRSRQQRTSPV